MDDPSDVSAEDTEGGSIGIDGMRLQKVVTDMRSGDDRQLVVGLYSCVVTLWLWK